jgi:hypothetical protein
MKTPASPAKLASLERARAAKAVKRAAELKAGGAVAGPIKVIKKVRCPVLCRWVGGGDSFSSPPQKKERQLALQGLASFSSHDGKKSRKKLPQQQTPAKPAGKKTVQQPKKSAKKTRSRK